MENLIFLTILFYIADLKVGIRKISCFYEVVKLKPLIPNRPKYSPVKENVA